MTATTDTARPPVASSDAPAVPAVADGVELLGPVSGSGYKDGTGLVRRADGQMVQLGPLMYALLEAADGHSGIPALARSMSERLGRRFGEAHVTRLIEKLAAQGLLAGSEHRAPPRRSPLLALRFKVLVTNPDITRRLTAPFAFLFRPWVMWPSLGAFVFVCWFVLVHKGVAPATAQAFHSPGLLLLVFGLGVLSAAIHEFGHAAACRYSGATPGGMGAALYLVWPAFYTDVTDAYRLDRRGRLRVDLAGLYFNALVAVVTMAVWLAVRTDALLLLVALQLLQMVRQLSPVIRADGYHILSDATGVPDLFAHLGPTLRRLVPGRREPSALKGWARVLVTAWVLVIVPVLASLLLGAVLLFPRLATSAWDSGRHLAVGIPAQLARGDAVGVAASVVELLALLLPVVGSVLIVQKFSRSMTAKALAWSQGRPARRGLVFAIGAGIVALLAWAWWPAGQYQPVRADERGTIGSFLLLLRHPAAAAHPQAAVDAVQLALGHYLALAMVPVGGATPQDPALLVLPGSGGHQPVAIVDGTGSATGAGAATGSGSATGTGTATNSGGSAQGLQVSEPHSTVVTSPSGGRTSIVSGGARSGPTGYRATAFPFALPAGPGPTGTQATAVNTRNHGVTYDVSYALVTVTGGAPVTESNSAYALARCRACTTVAVSFQVVLVVGQSNVIAPVNAAGALNYDCPACTTTAVADQMVLTLQSVPSAAVDRQLVNALQQLDALPLLGATGTPTAVLAQVDAVQQQVTQILQSSGLETPTTSSTTTTTTTVSSSSSGTSSSSATTEGTGASSSNTGPTTTTTSATTTTTSATTTTTTAAG
jgi:putative peptide zinc metalloprotease protein